MRLRCMYSFRSISDLVDAYSPPTPLHIPMMMNTFSRFLLAAGVLAQTACSGDGSTTVARSQTARIAIEAVAPTLTVSQGMSAVAALTITRIDFGGAVVLTAEGVPSGVTASFAPATVSAGISSSSLALEVAGTAASGTSAITVRARSAGVPDVTTTIALTITATASGTVSLALSPASSTITAGQTATSTLTITRGGGFTGGVNMTVTGAPGGMTTAFSTSNPVTAGSVALSLGTTTSVVPGPYTLTVRANAPGLSEATATYLLTVNAPPSNTVAYRYCATARVPLWFAYLDGTNGTWQRVTESSTGVYNFAVGQPTVGIASVYNDRGVIVTDVRYYGLAEMSAAATAECAENPAVGTKTLSGTVTGFASASESANVAIGNSVSSIASLGNPSFSMQQVQGGPRDLVAVRDNNATGNTERVLLVRATNFADNGTTGPLDLGAGASFVPGSSTVTITAPNDGALVGTTNFTTANGSAAALSIGALSSGVTATYQGVPDANLIASDVQRVTVQQSVGASLNRTINRFIRGPVAITMSMPADPGAPTLTAVTGASYPRATAAGTMPSAFNRDVQVQWDHAAIARRWLITSTSAARGGSLSYSLTMADFSTVPGWMSSWQMPAGSADVNSRFFGQTGAGPDGEPINGTTTFSIGRRTQYTF